MHCAYLSEQFGLVLFADACPGVNHFYHEIPLIRLLLLASD